MIWIGRRVPALLMTLTIGITSITSITTLSCGGPPPPPPAKKESAAQWADVFNGTPDIYAVVRVQALKGDAVYGSFWKSLIRAAQARGFARGATMIEAAEGSDEIVLGINKGGDAALVFRGVPASLDPAKISDANGQPLFRAVNDRAKVPEYELLDRRNPEPGALFVLPDRTWVGTLGAARGRARQVFVTPLNRPVPQIAAAESLVALRFGGAIAHVFDRHSSYGPLTKKLTSATFTLSKGKGGFVIALEYPDADATAWAEMQAKRIASELATDEKKFGWLKDAKIAYEGNTVFVRVAIPARLLEELPNASGADLPF